MLGGVFVNTVGWRVGYIIGGAVSFVSFIVGIWSLPKDLHLGGSVATRLAKDIDWVGAIVASTSLALLSYVLA